MYVNRSCSWFITSIAGFTGVLAGGFTGVIKCIKERSASVVVILKAWFSVKDL
jgi:hypothetical protein